MADAPHATHRETDRIAEGTSGPGSAHSIRPGRRLPAEAKVDSSFSGWTIRLPVRAEQITVEKRPMVFEEVVVRRRPRADVVRAHDTLRRERLRVEPQGEAELTRAPDAGKEGHPPRS